MHADGDAPRFDQQNSSKLNRLRAKGGRASISWVAAGAGAAIGSDDRGETLGSGFNFDSDSDGDDHSRPLGSVPAAPQSVHSFP